ncbi:hypothetical protein F5Y16DRAFT_372419 [Xylariaceae sp. FL0255]|nr:hypothetical protein F5Y16DRAFT_372419 [Xylariaceae sp. FL0255]
MTARDAVARPWSILICCVTEAEHIVLGATADCSVPMHFGPESTTFLSLRESDPETLSVRQTNLIFLMLFHSWQKRLDTPCAHMPVLPSLELYGLVLMPSPLSCGRSRYYGSSLQHDGDFFYRHPCPSIILSASFGTFEACRLCKKCATF